jgi:hypothetical protein
MYISCSFLYYVVFNNSKFPKLWVILYSLLFFLMCAEYFPHFLKYLGFTRYFDVIFNFILFLEIKTETKKMLFTKHLKFMCFDRVSLIFAKMQI